VAESPVQSAPPVAQTGDGTHVVQRGETLSGIASRLSGGDTARSRAWMLAIYQANPHAFDGNMNIMRSGAVLRIPDSTTVDSISSAEATAEIRRQYAAWRGSAPGASSSSESGRLRLVAPTETGGAGGSSQEAEALRSRVQELERQLAESRRALE